MLSVSCGVGVVDWVAPSVAGEKEDGFCLCTALLDMKFGVMLDGFLVF